MLRGLVRRHRTATAAPDSVSSLSGFQSATLGGLTSGRDAEVLIREGRERYQLGGTDGASTHGRVCRTAYPAQSLTINRRTDDQPREPRLVVTFAALGHPLALGGAFDGG
jgi:hypothetical protein